MSIKTSRWRLADEIYGRYKNDINVNEIYVIVHNKI